MKTTSLRRASSIRLVASAIGVAFIPGCGVLLLFLSFPPGTYTGDLACTGVAVPPGGSAETTEYDTTTTLAVDQDRSVSIDGVDVALGEEVTRSIPNASLAFEITRITRAGSLLRVVYEPRPTLPGITIDGELVETYRWVGGAIEAAAVADLTIDDVDGTTTLAIQCEGTLEPD